MPTMTGILTAIPRPPERRREDHPSFSYPTAEVKTEKESGALTGRDSEHSRIGQPDSKNRILPKERNVNPSGENFPENAPAVSMEADERRKAADGAARRAAGSHRRCAGRWRRAGGRRTGGRDVWMDGHTEQRDRGGVESGAFGARAELNGRRGNAAVAVQRTAKHEPHAVRILTPEGEVFELDISVLEINQNTKKEAGRHGSRGDESPANSPSNPASETILPESGTVVNPSGKRFPMKNAPAVSTEAGE